MEHTDKFMKTKQNKTEWENSVLSVDNVKNTSEQWKQHIAKIWQMAHMVTRKVILPYDFSGEVWESIFMLKYEGEYLCKNQKDAQCIAQLLSSLANEYAYMDYEKIYQYILLPKNLLQKLEKDYGKRRLSKVIDALCENKVIEILPDPKFKFTWVRMSIEFMCCNDVDDAKKLCRSIVINYTYDYVLSSDLPCRMYSHPEYCLGQVYVDWNENYSETYKSNEE